MYFFCHSVLSDQISLEFKINRVCVCVRIYRERERENTWITIYIHRGKPLTAATSLHGVIHYKGSNVGYFIED